MSIDIANYCNEIGIRKISFENNSGITVKDVYSDSAGYKYSLSDENIKTMSRRNSLPAKFFRNNYFTLNNIKNYIVINNIPIELKLDNPEITTATEKLDFTCSIHGDFKKTWNDIKNGQYCPDCGNKQRGNSKKQDFNYIISEFNKVGYQVKTEKYINNEMPIEYTCDKHFDLGVQKMSWGAFISDQRCFHCTKIKTIALISKPHGVFISEIKDIYGDNIRIVGNYTNSKNKIETYCNTCEMPFFSKPNHLLDGHLGCNCKAKSLGEDRIKDHLNIQNATYEPQYRIKECRNKKPLPFDFAVFSDDSKERLLFLVEFQGKQHYNGSGWSSDAEKNQINFENRIRNDEIKRNFCLLNHIKLVTIPYWDINKISEILNIEYKRISA